MNNEGTVVWMRLANRSHKQIKEVFDMFSDGNNGFNKTSIPMKNVFGNNFLFHDHKREDYTIGLIDLMKLNWISEEWTR